VLIGLIDPALHNCTKFVLDELWLIPITEPSTVRRFGQTYFFHPRTYPAHLAMPFTHTTQYPPTPLPPNYTIHFQFFFSLTWPSFLVFKDIFCFLPTHCHLQYKKILIVIFEEDDNEPKLVIIFFCYFFL
jgi:hypothetical protein